MLSLAEYCQASGLYDDVFETRKWCQEIPYINFPSDVQIKVIPAFAGAVVRFLVSKGEKSVSVYLDCYNILGIMKKPYWEIYPYKDDTYRCYLEETDELLEKILEELDREDEFNLEDDDNEF